MFLCISVGESAISSVVVSRQASVQRSRPFRSWAERWQAATPIEPARRAPTPALSACSRSLVHSVRLTGVVHCGDPLMGLGGSCGYEGRASRPCAGLLKAQLHAPVSTGPDDLAQVEQYRLWRAQYNPDIQLVRILLGSGFVITCQRQYAHLSPLPQSSRPRLPDLARLLGPGPPTNRLIYPYSSEVANVWPFSRLSQYSRAMMARGPT